VCVFITLCRVGRCGRGREAVARVRALYERVHDLTGLVRNAAGCAGVDTTGAPRRSYSLEGVATPSLPQVCCALMAVMYVISVCDICNWEIYIEEEQEQEEEEEEEFVGYLAMPSLP